jgi:hypothetical protein
MYLEGVRLSIALGDTLAKVRAFRSVPVPRRLSR